MSAVFIINMVFSWPGILKLLAFLLASTILDRWKINSKSLGVVFSV